MQKKTGSKKALRASLGEKLRPVLQDAKEGFLLTEKKFEKLVKKAAHLVADTLHKSHKGPARKKTPVAAANKITAKQVRISKTAPKKAAPKKGAKKAAKKKK